MEKMADAAVTLETVGNLFDNLLDTFCLNNNVADKYDMYPSMWNAALRYIYNNIFKPNKDILKPNVANGAYNLDSVDAVADIYIYKCFIHNQEISIAGFSIFTGITPDVIYSWGSRKTRTVIYKDLQGNILNNMQVSRLSEDEYVVVPSTRAQDIFKKIKEMSEESLVSLLKDRRNNPMKYLPILNRRYQWNLPGVSRERTDKADITAADIRAKLLGNDKQLQQIGENTTTNNLDTIKEALITGVADTSNT